MRLWHKDLIPVLPREQLVAQWRECSAIAGAILQNGTPNHLLVNKVLAYDLSHFIQYSKNVRAEMTKRGYRTMDSVMKKIESVPHDPLSTSWPVPFLFEGWHNDRYLKQCYYNLQEKFDCGGITLNDWYPIEQLIQNKFAGDVI